MKNVVFACAIALSAASANAVVWSEPVHGDLGELYWYSNPQPGDSVVNFGTLGAGTHTLSGTNIQQSLGFGGNYFEGDAVRFTVAPGTQVSSILFSHNQTAGIREFLRLSGSSVVATYVARAFPAHAHSSPNYGVWVSVDLITHDVPGAAPLGPGEYLISWDNQTFSTTMDYTMDIVVIPAPPALAGVALASVLGLARRRRV